MSDLLTTPLLTGETRRELRETLLNSRRSMQSLAARNSKSAASEAAAKPIVLKDHPLLGLFGNDPVALAAGAGRLAAKLRTELQLPYSALRESSAAVKLANDAGVIGHGSGVRIWRLMKNKHASSLHCGPWIPPSALPKSNCTIRSRRSTNLIDIMWCCGKPAGRSTIFGVTKAAAKMSRPMRGTSNRWPRRRSTSRD